MSDQLTLSAEARERAGKGASRAMRREGRVPAVIYGDKKDPEPIHLAERELMKLLHTGHFMNSLVSLDIGGSKTNALPKDVQFHPVNDRPMHVDFLRIGKGATVTLAVPVSFVNEEESPGLKRGGVLNVVRHELELTCPADDIPSEIVVELDGLEVGDSVHISQVELPEGVTSAIDDRDFTIAGVVAPSALKRADSEEEEGEEGEEGEEVAADEVPTTAQGDGEDGEGGEDS
ncbi:50S ribosomal protein L25/general stress protein Ctc [Parasphingopyxis algicola]|uniref:50S ribosomal protein L25/general stress protein Ctc n=1 Tax=Parasphingopyxis algicola TaxID=2026624 RepID=UPI0015A00FCF|nr:50S ribosomal protein L25/general stress protein Ctc [Parasphingopyxis algicola]QLC24517.1 50S ribosomal protein L25/general stress protein Ctc [Parasphingopyxis algicola]